jgi:hypothetical protein
MCRVNSYKANNDNNRNPSYLELIAEPPPLRDSPLDRAVAATHENIIYSEN